MAQFPIAEVLVKDPYYTMVTLLLPFNGADGSHVYPNVVASMFTVNGVPVSAMPGTQVGTAQIGTAQSKYGGAALALGGAGHISYPSANTIVMSGDFTIECWAYSLGNSNGYIYGNFGSNSLGNNSISWQSGGVVVVNTSGNNGFGSTGAPISDNVWHHIALCRIGSALTLFIDGAIRGTFTQSGIWGTSSYDLRIGNTNWTNYWWNGYIDDFRITNGVARYTANFTPPVEEFPWADPIEVLYHSLAQTMGRLIEAPPEAQDALGVRNNILLPQRGQRDIYYGGTGQITGTVKEKGTPDAPLHRRVCLIEEPSRTLIRETWSDALTGAYVFPNVDRSRSYTVLSYDHTNVYRAVIADKQIPELMP